MPGPPKSGTAAPISKLRIANDLALIGVLAVAYLCALTLATSHHADFAAFWLAGKAVLAGHNPYDLAELTRIRAQTALPTPAAPFFNPPPFLLIAALMARLSEPWALGLWLAPAAMAVAVLTWRLAPRTYGLALLFPATYWCATVGQTGFLTAALMMGAALTLESQPLVAGALIGGLIIKPQLALLAPVLLIHHRRAFIAAALTVAVLWGAAELAFPGATAQFLTHNVRGELADRAYLISRLRGVYGAALTLHAPVWAAVGLQAVATLSAGVVIWLAGRSDRSGVDKVAVLAAAIPIATPYLFSYDLVVLILPLALLATRRPWVVAACFLASASAWALEPLPLEPAVQFALLAIFYRCTRPSIEHGLAKPPKLLDL